MSAPRATRAKWKVALMVFLAVSFVRLLGATWRIRLVNGDVPATLRAEGRAFVFVLWHGEMLPLFWHHRNQGVVAVVSEHRDGDLITAVIEAFGFRAVRGSTSRGGGRALLQLAQELRDGSVACVTVDGPRGPAGEFAPGALVAAQRSGVPVVPVAAGVPRAWRMRSWDRFMIPKPFAKVTIAYGAAALVPGDSARAAAAETPRFQALLNETVARARG